MKRRWLTLGMVLSIAWIASSARLQAAPVENAFRKSESRELIVLLAAAPSAPAPEEVVALALRRQILPSGLDVGQPERIRLAISRRARGMARQRLEEDPQSLEARLHRYVVLSYPAGTDLDAVREILSSLPYVEHVHKSRTFYLSTQPSDPLLPLVSGGVTRSPEEHQWGTLALNLPAAWDHAKGHAYVGVLDGGLDTDHEDLAPQYSVSGIYQGGNFREHLSYDFGDSIPDANVDEKQGTTNIHAGHGTHVSGIIAATTNNGKGVAGVCWNCSLMMAKILDDSKGFAIHEQDVVDALDFVIDKGAQVVNMSFGRIADTGCENSQLDLFCSIVALAEQRDLVLVAASGNSRQHLQFPASDPRFIAVGGIEPGGAFWDEGNGDPHDDGCPAISCSGDPDCECGSNYTVHTSRNPQTLVAPAADVLSTFYTDATWNNFGCASVPDPLNPSLPKNYGLCTGTSMSAPFVTGLAGIVRSVNPLLTKDQVESALTGHASHAGSPDTYFGHGIPDAAASVQAVLGRAGGTLLPNRLTPLFTLYSAVAGDHFYTTFPQMGAAAIWSSDAYSVTGSTGGLWTDAPDFGYFPGAGCVVGPCLPEPGASVYVFTTDHAPGSHPLVPLYRMSKASTKDVLLATTPADVATFRGSGYKLDGIEGYVYQLCTPEPSCVPAGAVRLYRRLNTSRGDYAVFPPAELTAMAADGYTQVTGDNWIGYAYPNTDSDFDHVINGFELLAGTNAAVTDSDCDGVDDGQELLTFGTGGYGDPAQGPCGTTIFADVPPSHWARAYAEAIYVAGVTSGCASNPLSFCPDSPVSRDQMAVFLLKAKEGSSYLPPAANCLAPVFSDVSCTSGFARWIEELYRRGITTGCATGPLRYCPGDPVNRAQMAVFLLRAKEGSSYTPPTANCLSPSFADVPCTHWAAAWIEELARRGITTGCGGGNYCPDSGVIRAQMAVFLVRTFGIPFR